MAQDAFQTALKKINKEVGKLDGYNLSVSHSDTNSTILLSNPWNDESVAFIAFDDGKIKTDLFKCLKKVRLPEELSAIYHIEDNSLEIIWTAYKLGKSSGEIYGRTFEFQFKDQTYKCRFADSSRELMILASHAAYMQISRTSFRNLQSFSIHSNEKAHSDPRLSERLGTPVSFFIDGLSDDPEEWFDLIKHLNFYLKYYDNESPYIVVHDTEEEKRPSKIRYIEGKFPESISSRQLNGTLLALWTASYTHDITTRFLLYYRILEYVSGTYLQARQRDDLRRILSAPTAQAFLDKTLDSVAQVVRQDSTNEFDRFQKMFKDLVGCEKVWAEICACSEIFTSTTEFDGGLQIDPLIHSTNEFKNFQTNGMTALAAALRKIRHGLAHGGEQQVGQLILPTNRNFDILVPWTHLAMVAAADVLLYDHLG